jgi:hypothetical protein
MQEYGDDIHASIGGHGELHLIIKWARYISRDFRELKDTADLFARLPDILRMLNGYAKTTTPEKLLKRIEDTFRANYTFIDNSNRKPNKEDVREELIADYWEQVEENLIERGEDSEFDDIFLMSEKEDEPEEEDEEASRARVMSGEEL